jgi:serine/threonine protein kinase
MGDLETVSQQTTGCWPAGDNPPPTVSDYDLLRLIGQGGFGQVWLAKNRTTGHLRAVKVIPLHRSGTTDPAGREITSLTRLEANLRRQHPNLLNIHHVGTTPAYVFYVMDLADDASGNPGSSQPDYRPATLQSRLEAGPLAAEQCLCYARQLLAGLASLHQAGMVHRDVKPANCLFVDGELKLADFGLVTEANPQVSRVGTLKYMPPDGHMDTRADVYAAGLVIYEMLTGLPVESFPRLGDRAQQAVETPILGMLNRVALRACEPDPQRRFRDAGEMLAHLQKRGSELPSKPLPEAAAGTFSPGHPCGYRALGVGSVGPVGEPPGARPRQLRHPSLRGHDLPGQRAPGRHRRKPLHHALHDREPAGAGPSRGLQAPWAGEPGGRPARLRPAAPHRGPLEVQAVGRAERSRARLAALYFGTTAGSAGAYSRSIPPSSPTAWIVTSKCFFSAVVISNRLGTLGSS